MPKLFSRILAGLSIQTKILVFIVPIALLIVAIASVSLLTGKVIGQQLEGAARESAC